jgi:hypothetical protein
MQTLGNDSAMKKLGARHERTCDEEDEMCAWERVV